MPGREAVRARSGAWIGNDSIRRVRRSLAAFLVVGLVPQPVAAELIAVSLAARGSYDVGSVSVPGTDQGLGAGASLRLAFRAERGAWELSLDHDVAGYSGAGDGDPILQFAVTVSRRRELGAPGGGLRPYWSIGGGLGFLGLGASGGILPLRATLGLAFLTDRNAGLELALFERATLIYGGGDPSFDFINGVGIELALRFGR
jgi:hypothetical protein